MSSTTRRTQKEGRRIKCPMLHLWASAGRRIHSTQQNGGALGIWKKWADNVQGRAVKGGHFFPEENPTTHGTSNKIPVSLNGG